MRTLVAAVAVLLLLTKRAAATSCSGILPANTSCAVVQLHTLDASLHPTTGHFVFIARNVQLSTTTNGTSIHLPQDCDYKSKDPSHAGKWLSRISVSAARLPQCKKMQGTWLLMQDQAHSQQNMFEELNMMWYPAFLATRHVCSLNKSSTHVTHIGEHLRGFFPWEYTASSPCQCCVRPCRNAIKCNVAVQRGTRRGWLAFDDVYRSFGTYIPYEMLQAGGAVFGPKKATGCVEFETAVLIQTGYSWNTRPINNHYNHRLAAFAHAIVEEVGAEHIKPHKCKKQLTFVLRNRIYRNITNMPAVTAGIQKAFPDLTLVVQDTAALSFREQVELLRKTDILIFMHGGAGPLAIFLPAGAAAIEMFPYSFADPLYRNIAVMTNHVYFVWQNKDISKAHDLTQLKRNSNTEVDIPSLLTVIQSAVHAVAATTFDSFLGYDGETLNSTYCGWCGSYLPSSCTRD